MVMPMRQFGFDIIHRIPLYIKACYNGMPSEIPCLLQIQFNRLARIARFSARSYSCEIISPGITTLLYLGDTRIYDELVSRIPVLQCVPIDDLTPIVIREVRFIEVIIFRSDENTPLKNTVPRRIGQIGLRISGKITISIMGIAICE